jgi:hypothetical protein
MTDGLGESAGAASTEALVNEIHDLIEGVGEAAKHRSLCGMEHSCSLRMVEVLIDRALRERERAALERAAKAVGALYGTCVTPKEHDPAWCASCDVRNDAFDEAEQVVRALLGGE